MNSNKPQNDLLTANMERKKRLNPNHKLWFYVQNNRDTNSFKQIHLKMLLCTDPSNPSSCESLQQYFDIPNINALNKSPEIPIPSI